MTDHQLRTADALLDTALGLPPGERPAFLEAHVPPELSDHVRQLLAAADADDPLLDLRPVTVGEARAAVGVERGTPVGEVVGPYRIVGFLGDGGMGRVYRAERADGAFEREVALKLVRQSLTLAGANVAERLRQERAVLASLDHPHIARLYDGGETDDGVPWVAMELVEGEPITAYADALDLDVRARVSLAVDVCGAVEHAHRRLVVHRDLKPSNVFVAPDEDGAPVVKLLDFGIARLLDVEADGLTRTGGLVLTPEYAAPEQLHGGDITTATDVWALGALLYEVLSGRRPFASDRDSGDRLGDLRARERALQEQPAAPSAVASAPDRAHRLRGDLDAIVLQALRAEPEERYASAGALGDDLRRHLDGLPVLARPPSRRYLARAFVRRNRVAVAAAAAVAVALIVGLAASLVSLDRERDARAQAQAEAARAEAAFEFVIDLFGGNDGAALSTGTTAGALLEAGERGAAAFGAGREAERAVAYGALREIYGRLERADEAHRAGAEALRAAREAYGPDHPHTLDAMGRFALFLANDLQLDRALPLVESAARGYRALGDAGQRPLGRLLAEFGQVTAWAVYNAPVSPDWSAVSERMLDEARPVIRATQDSVALMAYVNGRAHLVELQDGIAASAPLWEAEYRISRALFGDSFQTLGAMSNFGDTLRLIGDYDGAVALFDSLLASSRRTIGADHRSFTLFLSSASTARIERGTPGDLERALDWTAVADRADAGPHPWSSIATLARLTALRASGRWAELDARSARAIDAFEASGDTSRVDWARTQRAFARLGLGDDVGARALAGPVAADGDGESAALAHVVQACVASGLGDADQTRASLGAARRALDRAGLPPHSLTSRLVRAGPEGGACDGWVPGR